MAIKKLYVSHENYDFNKLPAHFIDTNNFKKYLNSNELYDCSTSLADIGFDNLENLIINTIEIELIELDENFLLKANENNYYGISRFLSIILKSKKPVANFDWIQNINPNKFSVLDQDTKTENKTFWVFGCSVSKGTGVDTSERYGDLLSKKLTNYQYKNLSRDSSSIWYQSNRLLQSDIKENDLVIFGIPNVERIEVVKNDISLKPIPFGDYVDLPNNLKYWNISYFESKTLFSTSINHILSVINFCDKVKSKLILANILDPVIIPVVFNQNENFINLVVERDKNYKLQFIDLGNDNAHPGPIQHKLYADKLYDFIKEKNYL